MVKRTYGYGIAQEVDFVDTQAYDAEAWRALDFYRKLLRVEPEIRPVSPVCTALPAN